MMQTSKKQKNIEIAKSVILVVLFLSTILLLYGFWWNVKPMEIGLDAIGSQNTSYESLRPQEVIAPSILEISYGDGRYGVINGDTRKYWWNKQGLSITGGMKDFFAAGNIFVEAITKDQYREVLASESLKVVFDYNLPLGDTFKLYGIFRPSGLANISNINEIAYSFGSMESLFIYDGKQESYYRIVGEGDFLESKTFTTIYLDLTESAYIAYPLYKMIGDETTNATLVPLPTEFSYTISTYNNERLLGPRDFEKTLAKTFFGETFDFTRVIEDAKGNVTYMYGYGERVFVADRDGSFRYKREGGSKTSTSDISSLEMALDFIALHGGTQNSLGDQVEIRLFKVKREDGRPPKITFYFQIQKETGVLYEQGAAFIVECSGDTVTGFSRDLFIEDDIQSRTLSAGEYTAVNVLAKNYEEMAQILETQGFIKNKGDKAFEKVTDEIKGIRLVKTRFAKTEEGLGKLETCWSFSFRKNGQIIEFYYSIRDALPMGYSVR
ncbi:MAG: hypothetical protein RBS51_03180 [Anaerovoracaceae bacterium]|jgi:hypothetical protein|nr:hypothetical protein [Anaerovoracaceae bacterium]